MDKAHNDPYASDRTRPSTLVLLRAECLRSDGESQGWRRGPREPARMIHVVAVITAIPGQRDALIAAYKENVANVLAEAGCIQYAGVVDVEGFGRAATPMGPDAFVVIEKWESADALKTHAAAPHMVTFGTKTKAITASRAIHILTEV